MPAAEAHVRSPRFQTKRPGTWVSDSKQEKSCSRMGKQIQRQQEARPPAPHREKHKQTSSPTFIRHGTFPSSGREPSQGRKRVLPFPKPPCPPLPPGRTPHRTHRLPTRWRSPSPQGQPSCLNLILAENHCIGEPRAEGTAFPRDPRTHPRLTPSSCPGRPVLSAVGTTFPQDFLGFPPLLPGLLCGCLQNTR